MQASFERATRLKVRFKTDRGILTTEDLWDLKLEDLNTLAKALNKEVKESAEESFIVAKSPADAITELKFEMVKYVIGVKREEDDQRKIAAEKRKRRQQLVDLISNKENEALAAKSVDELKKELMELED